MRISYGLTVCNEHEELDNLISYLLPLIDKEDEIVVENVQKGVRSSFYRAGRFSPKREKGVHHFHVLLSKFINQ